MQKAERQERLASRRKKATKTTSRDCTATEKTADVQRLKNKSK